MKETTANVDPQSVAVSNRSSSVTLSRKFPAWTLGLSILVLCVYFGHGAPVVGTQTRVLVTDRGLFIVSNPFSGNITAPVGDGTLTTELHPGDWGNWWVVNCTDHHPHVVGFRVLEQETGRIYADYNATISGNATIFIDLGSSNIGNSLATASWT